MAFDANVEETWASDTTTTSKMTMGLRMVSPCLFGVVFVC